VFDGATQYDRRMCDWDLSGKGKSNMFRNSPCTEVKCVDCPSTSSPTTSPTTSSPTTDYYFY